MIAMRNGKHRGWIDMCNDNNMNDVTVTSSVW